MLEAWRQGLEYGGHLASCLAASCIMNRIRLGWGAHLEVLKNIPNHSALNIEPNRDAVPSIWEPNFVRLLHEIEGIYNGTGQDYSKGGLYWADMRRIERPWFKDKILDPTKEDGLKEHPCVVDMNTLRIFR